MLKKIRDLKLKDTYLGKNFFFGGEGGFLSRNGDNQRCYRGEGSEKKEKTGRILIQMFKEQPMSQGPEIGGITTALSL